MYLKLIWMLLVFLIVPVYLGACIAKGMHQYQDRRMTAALFSFVCGTVCMWALFQLITVPMILLKLPFSLAVHVWCVVTCACVLALLAVYRVFWPFPVPKKPALSWKAVLILLILCLIGLQVFRYVFMTHNDDDDARFVVTAVEAYEKNTMMLIHPVTGEYLGTWIGERVKDVASPWMLYVALLAKLCRIHPTIMAHTVLPAVLLLMAYAVLWLIGDRLMKQDFVKTAFFVIFAAVIIQYFGGSTRTQGAFMLVRIWQGKAAFAAILLPLIFLAYLLRDETETSRRSWILFLLADIASCLMSGMGIFLGGILIGVYYVYDILTKRRWKDIWMPFVTCLPTLVYGLLYLKLK